MAKQLPLTLARRVKELREAAGLSQQQLATQAGLSMSLITQMEQGIKADPRLSTLQSLARALGVAVEALVNGLNEESSADQNPPLPAKGKGGEPSGEKPAAKKRGKGRGKS